MSRRDTIIISVLVNAALLCVLFITAVTSKSSQKEDVKQTTALLEETTIDAKELFSSNVENKEMLLANEMPMQEAQKEIVNLLNENEKNIKKEEEQVVYKLPEIANNLEQVKQEIASQEPSNNIYVTVKKGDTLEKIARLNNVKVDEIIKANNLLNSFLKIGQQLIIPKQKFEKIATVQQKPKTQVLAKDQPEYYTVKVGDNPYTIAVKHNLKLADFLKLNNLDEKKAKKLKPGDKLRIR